MTQLALEGLGGPSWYKVGWSGFIFDRVGLESGSGRRELGMDRSYYSQSGRATGPMLQRKVESQRQGALVGWAASAPSQAQPRLLCGPEQTSVSLWTEAESPVLFL